MLDEYSEFIDENSSDPAQLKQLISIHSDQSIKFYKEELKADTWVMDILKSKYRIPFTKYPSRYYEPNNLSALKNMDFLWTKMCEWENKGFCYRVSQKPYCCNPMTVSDKLDIRTGKVKKRPCMDFSRHVNTFIPDQPVRLSNLDEAEKMLQPGDFQTSYDMENQYFQILVHEDYWKFLGCEIFSPEGLKVYFVFKVMIYGLKSAVFTVKNLQDP